MESCRKRRSNWSIATVAAANSHALLLSNIYVRTPTVQQVCTPLPPFPTLWLSGNAFQTRVSGKGWSALFLYITTGSAR